MASPTRKLFYLFDWPLFLVILTLIGLGLVNLYSATASGAGVVSPVFYSQIIWSGLGLGGLLLALGFHYRRLMNGALPFYLLTLALILLVSFFGVQAGGQKNWLALGPIRMQPSELAKLSLILILARHFALHPLATKGRIRDLLKPALYCLLPFGLLLVEGDVGSAIFFILIGFSLFFLAGLKKRFLLGAVVLTVLAGGVGYQYFLKDYQRARIESFLHPEKDPRGRGYHLLQSKIAVGSGQWTGKGFLEGRLNKLKFLPERHTDFVFPVLAEEWGFLGSVGTLMVFGAFFILMFQAAGKVEDPFGSLLIAGVGSWLFWQWVLNLGGVLGLIPLAGVTLPFFSYGGSALLTNLLALGLALNVYMRRYVF